MTAATIVEIGSSESKGAWTEVDTAILPFLFSEGRGSEVFTYEVPPGTTLIVDPRDSGQCIHFDPAGFSPLRWWQRFYLWLRCRKPVVTRIPGTVSVCIESASGEIARRIALFVVGTVGKMECMLVAEGGDRIVVFFKPDRKGVRFVPSASHLSIRLRAFKVPS